jgi:hypothetical protein
MPGTYLCIGSVIISVDDTKIEYAVVGVFAVIEN